MWKARREPVEITVTCNDSKVELRVNDHTAGFRWPERAQLPEPECERGRGLFLIQCLMDSTGYFRGQRENSLVMRKARCHHGRSHNCRGLRDAGFWTCGIVGPGAHSLQAGSRGYRFHDSPDLRDCGHRAGLSSHSVATFP